MSEKKSRSERKEELEFVGEIKIKIFQDKKGQESVTVKSFLENIAEAEVEGFPSNPIVWMRIMSLANEAIIDWHQHRAEMAKNMQSSILSPHTNEPVIRQ